MKILFDGGVPRGLHRFLESHEVGTTQALGWATYKNGALLRQAEARFDVLLTTDAQMAHQQNPAGRRLAILVLLNFRWRWVRADGAEFARAVERLQPGAYREFIVPIPPPSATV